MSQWNSIVLQTLTEALTAEDLARILAGDNTNQQFDLRSGNEIKKANRSNDIETNSAVKSALMDLGIDPDMPDSETPEQFIQRLEITIPSALSKKAANYIKYANMPMNKDTKRTNLHNYIDLEFARLAGEYTINKIKAKILFNKIQDLIQDDWEYVDEDDFETDELGNITVDNRKELPYTSNVNYERQTNPEFNKAYLDYMNQIQDPWKVRGYLQFNDVKPTKIEYDDHGLKATLRANGYPIPRPETIANKWHAFIQ